MDGLGPSVPTVPIFSDKRRLAGLKAIAEEHLRLAQPVPSSAVLTRSGIPASSATVRRSQRERLLLRSIAGTLVSIEQAAAKTPQIAGVSAMLTQPEFRSVTRVQKFLDLLNGGTLTRRLDNSPRVTGEVSVYIGSDQDDEVMAELSTVSAHYGYPDHGAGMIAVVGPQRLHYGRAIATVETVASALTGLLLGGAA